MGTAAFFVGCGRRRLRSHVEHRICRIKPLVPAKWKWLALKRFPYHGAELTYFATRESGTFHIRATAGIESDLPMKLTIRMSRRAYKPFPTTQRSSHCSAGARYAFSLGTFSDTITASLNLLRLLDARTMYDVCLYDSERDGWQPGEIDAAKDIGTVALSIEMGGYRLISLRPHLA